MAITSNMGLTLPDVSVTPGPTWASQINSDLTLIDQHNHTTGFGAPIPVAALDINDALDFGNNAATGLSYVGLNPQAAPGQTSSLYVDGNGDFWYKNSSGSDVQITSAGGLAATPGSIGGLPSGTAAVTYLLGAGKYVFTKATNQAAVMDVGPLIIRTGTAGSGGVVLTPHPSTASYGLQLPASLPGNPNVLLGSSSLGIMAFFTTDSTLALTSNSIGVSPGGITATQLATNSVETAKIKDAQVTYAKLQASNTVVPPGGGTGSTTSTTYDFLSVTGTLISVVAGRPLFVTCISDSTGTSGNEAYFQVIGSGKMYLRFYAAGLGGFGACQIGPNTDFAPSVMSFVIANPAAGGLSILLQGKVDPGCTLSYTGIKIVAYQI